jgi:hypothetical protein
MMTVTERVNHLEDLMAQLLETTAQTSRELREFKQEMREFKDEMHAIAARTEQDMREFKQEMREFKDEMREFKNETRQFQKEVRRDFGEVSRQFGLLVENMVAPGIPKMFQDITGLAAEGITFSAIRVKKKMPAAREFDAVVAGGGYVLINETKSTLRPDYVHDFYAVMAQDIHAYFPEYEGSRFIGVVSSLYVDTSIVTLGSKLGLFVLGFGDDLLDVLNPRDFTPRYF